MKNEIYSIFTPLVISVMLSACATHTQVASSPAPVSVHKTTPGHFCQIKMPKDLGGIATTTTDDETAVGDCRNATWEQTDVIVMYFGDPNAQESPEQFDAERAASAAQANSMQAECASCEVNYNYAQDHGIAVHFHVNQDKPFDQSEVDAIITAAREAATHGAKKITIVGYTDSTGSMQLNHSLSIRRAQTIRQLLARAGVKTRIGIQGEGASNPVATNETAEGRAENRRAEMKEANDGNGH